MHAAGNQRIRLRRLVTGSILNICNFRVGDLSQNDDNELMSDATFSVCTTIGAANAGVTRLANARTPAPLTRVNEAC